MSYLLKNFVHEKHILKSYLNFLGHDFSITFVVFDCSIVTEKVWLVLWLLVPYAKLYPLSQTKEKIQKSFLGPSIWVLLFEWGYPKTLKFLLTLEWNTLEILQVLATFVSCSAGVEIISVSWLQSLHFLCIFVF